MCMCRCACVCVPSIISCDTIYYYFIYYCNQAIDMVGEFCIH